MVILFSGLSLMGEWSVSASGDPWEWTFEGAMTVRDGTSTETVCGKVRIESSQPPAWMLHLTFGTAEFPLLSFAGTDDTPFGTLREVILAAFHGAATTESDETPE